MKPEVSIVIPAFNESERLGGPLRTLLEFAGATGRNAELIVVDDGSSDDTAEIAKNELAARPDVTTNVIRYEENRGKGFAVKTGLLAEAPLL